MCGICAIVGRQSSEIEEHIRWMNKKLIHRGPDAQQIELLENISVGHCRLKIIDTSTDSNQPFTDNRYYLVYNGELYNFRNLKDELIQEGDSFETNGDTEVLFKWLRRFGDKRLTDLEGMFAFIFWDQQEQEVIAVRDPLGIKPLYYAVDDKINPSYIYFASELTAIPTQLPHVNTSIDEKAFSEYLQFQSNQSPNTLRKGINKLSPGEYLHFQIDGQIERQFYDHWHQGDIQIRKEATKDSFHRGLQSHLQKSVQKRLISDVPLGAFLSGGIDSSVVVAMMKKTSEREIRTFTLGFENSGLDERKYAREISNHLDTNHTEVVLSEQEILEKIPAAVNAMHVPSGDAINTYLVAEAAKESGLTVCLSGLGGDELVGGYPSFHTWNRAKLLYYLPGHRIISQFIPGLDKRQREKLIYFFTQECTPEAWVNSLRSVFLPDWLPESISDYISGSESNYSGSTGQQLSKAELLRYTIPLLLSDSDQMGMAHAMEIRVPLLDRTLVEWMLSQPDNLRLNQSGHPKQVFIDVISDLIPPEMLLRPKQGFVLPMDQWMRTTLKEYTASGLFHSPLPEYIDTEYLNSAWNKFIRKNDPRFTWSRIWTMSVLGHWMSNRRK